MSLLAQRNRSKRANRDYYHFEFYAQAEGNFWSKNNPNGVLELSVAENRLATEIFHERILQVGDFPLEACYYSKTTGIPCFTEGCVQLLNSTFLKDIQLNPDNLIITNGATSALEMLLFSILDIGDGVLIPRPYYFKYDAIIEDRVQGKCVSIDLDLEMDIMQQLEAKKQQSENSRVPIRALIVTNPDNPTGNLLSYQTLYSLAQWCADHQIHLVANEIYANSVFSSDCAEFHSLLEISQDCSGLEEHCHLVYGLAKDFGVAGLRVGMLYTSSQTLLQSLSRFGVYSSLPGSFQYQLTTVLQDEQFLLKYIEETKKRLRKSYTILTDGLKEIGIQFQEAKGGLFVWLDLRCFLESPNFPSERLLCSKLAQNGILLTPGELFKSQSPGYFRLCFTGLDPEGLPLIKTRLQACLELEKNNDLLHEKVCQ